MLRLCLWVFFCLFFFIALDSPNVFPRAGRHETLRILDEFLEKASDGQGSIDPRGILFYSEIQHGD